MQTAYLGHIGLPFILISNESHVETRGDIISGGVKWIHQNGQK